MHGITTRRKGHEYKYFTCSQKCGAPVIHMEEVDKAAIQYLRDLLSEENQRTIADALRQYRAGEGSRMEEFKQALNARVKAKQQEYDTLMKNLSSGVLPAEVVSDIGQQMQGIKTEISALKATEPPKDFTTDTIKVWLESIKAAPDESAVHLLIERIDIADKPEVKYHRRSRWLG